MQLKFSMNFLWINCVYVLFAFPLPINRGFSQEATDKKIALELQQQQAKLEQEERFYQEQLEQERQDRELALRLAQETNGQIEESPPLARKYVLQFSIFFSVSQIPLVAFIFTDNIQGVP